MYGCRITSTPSARASRPMIAPLAAASLRLKVAATARVAGMPVDAWRTSTPGGPSAKRRSGMPRRGTPRIQPAWPMNTRFRFLRAADDGELFLARHLREQPLHARREFVGPAALPQPHRQQQRERKEAAGEVHSEPLRERPARRAAAARLSDWTIESLLPRAPRLSTRSAIGLLPASHGARRAAVYPAQ